MIDEQDIREQLEDVKRIWTETIATKINLRDFYRREYKVNYLKTEGMLVDPYEYRSGIYDENVDRVSALISVPVRYSVNAKGLGPRPLQHAEKIEAFANAILPEIERKDGEAYDNHLCHEVINYGISAVSVLPDPLAWSQYPGAADVPAGASYETLLQTWGEISDPPITIQHIPFLTWRPLLSGRTVLKSFQIQKVFAVELKYKYPDLELPKTTKDTEEFEYVTYIDDEVCAYYVCQVGGTVKWDSFAKKPWKHHMPVKKGTAPVVLYQGLTTGDPELKYRFKGYAESITDSVRAMDMIISSQITRSAISAVPTMDLEIEAAVSPEQATKLNQAMTYKLGGANVSIPGTKWVPREFGKMSPVDEYAYQKNDAIIDSKFPPALRGQVGATTSGFAFNLSAEYALATLKPIQASMARSDVDVQRLIFMIPRAMSEIMGSPATIYVRKREDNATEAISISDDDVRDYGPLLGASREASLPTDKLADLQATDMAMNNCRFPRAWTYQEIMKVENPETLMEQREAEDMAEQEPLLSMRRNNILRRMQILKDTNEGVTPEQATQNGPLPPGMNPILQMLMGQNGGQMGAPPPQGNGMQPAGPPQGGSSVIGATPQPQQMAPPQAAPVGAQSGVAVRRPRNPRAGQKSQPGGPKRKTGSVQVKGSA